MVDKLNLRTWFLNLRTWTLGFSFEAFKTTCIDAEKTLREAAFFFAGIPLVFNDV